MSRRLALLVAVVVVAVLAVTLGVARTSYSEATYTTSSQTDVRATAEDVGSWLMLWSQATDQDRLTAYALRRQQTGTPPTCASGQDETLVLDMGTMRANNTSYTFNRTFTIHTAATYPDSAVTQTTVTATLVADPATGLQPIRDVRFATNTGGSATVTLAANTKKQANVRLRLNSASTPVGTVLHPTVRITVTYTGSAASYFVYSIPLTVTIGTW